MNTHSVGLPSGAVRLSALRAINTHFIFRRLSHAAENQILTYRRCYLFIRRRMRYLCHKRWYSHQLRHDWHCHHGNHRHSEYQNQLRPRRCQPVLRSDTAILRCSGIKKIQWSGFDHRCRSRNMRSSIHPVLYPCCHADRILRYYHAVRSWRAVIRHDYGRHHPRPRQSPRGGRFWRRQCQRRYRQHNSLPHSRRHFIPFRPACRTLGSVYPGNHSDSPWYLAVPPEQSSGYLTYR